MRSTPKDIGKGPMIRRGIAHQRLIAIFVFGVLLFSYPILAIFDRPESIAGIPLLLVYVFVVWAALIVVLALTIDRRR